MRKRSKYRPKGVIPDTMSWDRMDWGWKVEGES